MSIAFYAAIGCLIGVLLTVLSRPRSRKAFALDIGLSMSGAVAGAWFLSPMSESMTGRLNVAALTGAVFGAVVAVAMAKACRDG